MVSHEEEQQQGECATLESTIHQKRQGGPNKEQGEAEAAAPVTETEEAPSGEWKKGLHGPCLQQHCHALSLLMTYGLYGGLH